MAVETCVRSPEEVTDSVSGRRNLWRRHGKGYLRVTIAEEDEAVVVVTVAIRRKMPEEIR
jgi:hypothetical protein